LARFGARTGGRRKTVDTVLESPTNGIVDRHIFGLISCLSRSEMSPFHIPFECRNGENQTNQFFCLRGFSGKVQHLFDKHLQTEKLFQKTF
jgi:hypothetical protein